MMPTVIPKIARAAEALASRYRTQEFFVDCIPDYEQIVLYVGEDCMFRTHRAVDKIPVKVEVVPRARI